MKHNHDLVSVITITLNNTLNMERAYEAGENEGEQYVDDEFEPQVETAGEVQLIAEQ